MTKSIFDFGSLKFSLNKKGDRVKVTAGREVRYMKALELWGVAFEFARDKKTRDQLMPVRAKEIMKFKKVHTVELKHDMKAGETLQFSCIIDVPTYVIAGMRDMLEKEVPGAVKALEEVIPELSPPAPLLPKH